MPSKLLRAFLSRSSRVFILPLVAALVLVVLSFSPVLAGGNLDSGFGVGGVARIDFGGPTTGNQDFPQASVMQSEARS